MLACSDTDQIERSGGKEDQSTIMKVILIGTQSGDWEGLYINGKLVEQGHNIDRMDLLHYADQFKFIAADVTLPDLNDEDEETTMACGCLPNLLTDLKGNYE